MVGKAKATILISDEAPAGYRNASNLFEFSGAIQSGFAQKVGLSVRRADEMIKAQQFTAGIKS